MSRDFEVLSPVEDEAQASSKARTTSMPPRGTYPPIGEAGRWGDEETLRLVQQIFLIQTQEPPRVAVFAGVDHGNGCSRICTSVGEILAKNSRRPVCLVNANFRTSNVPPIFGSTTNQGLTDALMQKGPITSYVKPVVGTNLWTLPSGAIATDSPNLLSADSLQERILELRKDFDFVIIDTAPLSRYSDALILGQHSDGLVLVLEADATRRESASAAVAGLHAANVPILAAVLNKRTFPIPEKLYKYL